MSLCINPRCSQPKNPDDLLFCQSCSSELLLEERYRVIRVIGRGGFGKTYEISDYNSIKVLKVLINSSPKAVELFQREAKVLSQLNCPGIPKVEQDGYFVFHPKNNRQSLHCLVMEKIEGLNLKDYIEQKGQPIKSDAAVRWLRELTEILRQLHSHGIIHRDIKPANIILKPDRSLALIDFGAVKEGKKQNSTNTVEGSTIISSGGFTPTEQLNGLPVRQSDFFALGRTFVYLMTARELADMYDGLNDELHWREDAPDLSPLLANLIDRMMARIHDQRPANAEEILRALEDSSSHQKNTPSWQGNDEDETQLPPVPLKTEVKGRNKPEDAKIVPVLLETEVKGGNKPEGAKAVPGYPASQESSDLKTISLKKEVESGNEQDNKFKKIIQNNRIILSIASIFIVILGGLGVYFIKYLLSNKISKDTLVIRVLGKPEQYKKLQNYLKNNLVSDNFVKFITGQKIKITVDGKRNLTARETKNRIETKYWDIAFMISVNNSILAKDNNYTFAAAILLDKGQSTQSTQSALFTRKNSLIKSIYDTNINTIVALGQFDSASSFSMPVYDLYGKTLNIKAGNSVSETIKMVKSGTADIGTAPIRLVKNDPDLNILNGSRNIPVGGVYLSPNLAPLDQETIKQTLLKAPPEIQEESRYGAGKEEDYTKFREIIQRVNEILICTDFSKNPVNLFCPPGFKPTRITGRINGITIGKGDFYVLTVVDNQKKYLLSLKPKVVDEVFGSRNITEIQNKSVVVNLPKPPLDNGSGALSAEVTQSIQINIVP